MTDNNTKNATRIKSLLGTWTTEALVKTSIGGYKLEGHFITYFQCDSQLNINRCSMNNCSEINNNACILNKNNEETCVVTKDEIIDWSDVVAFFYLGGKIDAGFPFYIHQSYEMDGWVGPYNIILARDDSVSNETFDSYVVKYVESPKTPYLRMPAECKIFKPEDFNQSFGEGCVQNTVEFQSKNIPIHDWIQPHYKTCDNGDIKPILPMAKFDFIQDSKTGNETINVGFKYNLLTFPDKKDPITNFLKKLEKIGLPISGPYCYENDPNKAYSVEFSYESNNKNYANMYHSCINDLPCLPDSVQTCKCNDSSIDSNPVEPVSTTLDSVPIILTIGIFVLTITLIYLTIKNVILWRRLKSYEVPSEIKGYYSDVSFSDEEESITQPLLITEIDHQFPDLLGEKEENSNQKQENGNQEQENDNQEQESGNQEQDITPS